MLTMATAVTLVLTDLVARAESSAELLSPISYANLVSLPGRWPNLCRAAPAVCYSLRTSWMSPPTVPGGVEFRELSSGRSEIAVPPSRCPIRSLRFTSRLISSYSFSTSWTSSSRLGSSMSWASYYMRWSLPPSAESGPIPLRLSDIFVIQMFSYFKFKFLK